MERKNTRKSKYAISPMILNRWSPRAMSGEALSDEELFPLFEAARWAPSSFNNQPWRFVYAKRETPHWDRLFDLLVDFNKEWCKNGAALVLICSKTIFEKTKKPCRTHAFDTGAAWENLALEGFHRGLVVHGMEGFDYEKAKKLIPAQDHTIHAMCAIGKPGNPEMLSPILRDKETLSDRKKLEEILFEGGME